MGMILTSRDINFLLKEIARRVLRYNANLFSGLLRESAARRNQARRLRFSQAQVLLFPPLPFIE
jgi:hypothetical protein